LSEPVVMFPWIGRVVFDAVARIGGGLMEKA
jgi:hypothetical protein